MEGWNVGRLEDWNVGMLELTIFNFRHHLNASSQFPAFIFFCNDFIS